MADRLSEMSAPELERALTALGTEIELPSAPALATAVGERLRAPSAGTAVVKPARWSAPLGDRRRALLLIAAAVLALGAIAAAVRLSIGNVTIREDRAPSSPPTAVQTGPALGEPTTLERAREEVGFEVALPSELGSPDVVAVDHPLDAGDRVVLAWNPEPALPAVEGLPYGALLTEQFGDVASSVKTVYTGKNRVEEIELEGRPAVWITGRHQLDLPTSDGPRRFLVTGNVLLWAREGVTYRLETALPRSAALSLGASLE